MAMMPTPKIDGFNASPIGGRWDGHRIPQNKSSDEYHDGYHWERRPLMRSPGTGNYAFESLALNELTPIGPSTNTAGFLKVVQPPQLYVAGRAVPTTGLGGLVAGQVILQPLINPQGYSNQ